MSDALLDDLRALADEGYNFYRPFDSDPSMGSTIHLHHWITEHETEPDVSERS